MLHASVLPHKEQWRMYSRPLTKSSLAYRRILCRFLKNLKMVVVDELHYYSGSLGRYVVLIIPAKRYSAPLVTLPKSCGAFDGFALQLGVRVIFQYAYPPLISLVRSARPLCLL